VWVLTGLAPALVGLAPSAAVPRAWAVCAAAVVVIFFAESLDWPGWISDLSPLSWTPLVPVET
jgi:ABC-2 type transport system permease protein